MLRVIFGLLLLAGASTAQDCAAGVGDCVNTLFGVVSTQPDDREFICNVTGEFLRCVVIETRNCDPVVTASVKEGVSPMIELYQAEPYNCQIDDADKAALQQDKCSEEMTLCSVYFLQAENEPNYNKACGLFEDYLNCMTEDTTACGLELEGFILEHATNSTQRYDEAPYYCEERLVYDIDAVDANMTECLNILYGIDMRIAQQDYICGEYHSFFECAVESLAPASPRQFKEYAEYMNAASQSFRTYPYFCESANPCRELFRACNDSAYSPEIKPCELMDVYTVCLSRGLGVCQEDKYEALAEDVQLWRGELHNKYNCIASNKDKTFEELTEDNEDSTSSPPDMPQNDGTDTTGEDKVPQDTTGHSKENEVNNDHKRHNTEVGGDAPSGDNQTPQTNGNIGSQSVDIVAKPDQGSNTNSLSGNSEDQTNSANRETSGAVPAAAQEEDDGKNSAGVLGLKTASLLVTTFFVLLV